MPHDDSGDVAVTLEYFCRDQCGGGAPTSNRTSLSIDNRHRRLLPSSSDPVRMLVGESMLRIEHKSAIGIVEQQTNRTDGDGCGNGVLLCSRCVTEVGRIARCML